MRPGLHHVRRGQFSREHGDDRAQEEQSGEAAGEAQKGSPASNATGDRHISGTEEMDDLDGLALGHYGAADGHAD